MFLAFHFFFWLDVGLTDWAFGRWKCRVAGKPLAPYIHSMANVAVRIVEYATRDQAQNAVNTLSNQNLMGRLVYVREVCRAFIQRG